MGALPALNDQSADQSAAHDGARSSSALPQEVKPPGQEQRLHRESSNASPAQSNQAQLGEAAVLSSRASPAEEVSPAVADKCKAAPSTSAPVPPIEEVKREAD